MAPVAGLSESGAAKEGPGLVAMPPRPPGSAAADAVGVVGGVQGMQAVEGGVMEEDLTELGIDTLWNVTLTSQNAEVAASATQDLLEVSAIGVSRLLLLASVVFGEVSGGW